MVFFCFVCSNDASVVLVVVVVDCIIVVLVEFMVLICRMSAPFNFLESLNSVCWNGK